MNKTQEMFNRSVKGLMDQGMVKSSAPRTATSSVNTCMYRGPNNTKCAAGHLIEDEDYDPDMENKPINIVVNMYRDLKSFVGMVHNPNLLAMVGQLQKVHDHKKPLEWLSEWYKIADNHALSTEILDSYQGIYSEFKPGREGSDGG